MKESKKIISDEIKEFYSGKKEIFSNKDKNLYRAVFIDDDKKPTYLIVVEKGKISLYEQIFTNANGGMSMAWYVGKGSDNVQTFEAPAYI